MADNLLKLEDKLSGTLTSFLSASETASMGVSNPPSTVTKGYIIVDPDTSNEEKIYFSGVSGNTLTGLSRGVDNGGVGKDHEQGAPYEMRYVKEYQNGLVDALSAEHNDDGTHDTTKVAMLAGAQTFTGTKTFSSAPKMDQIDEATADAGVAVDGVLHKDGEIILDNTKSYKAKDSGGTERSIVKLNANNIEIGDGGLSGQLDFKNVFKSDVQYRCRAYLSSANQSIVGTGSWVTVSLDGESFDVGDMHSNTTNPSRITIPSGGDGIYLIVTQVRWSANSTGDRGLGIYVNGSYVEEITVDAANSFSTNIGLTTIRSLSGGDYVEMRVIQNSGSNIDIQAGEYKTFLVVYKLC